MGKKKAFGGWSKLKMEHPFVLNVKRVEAPRIQVQQTSHPGCQGAEINPGFWFSMLIVVFSLLSCCGCCVFACAWCFGQAEEERRKSTLIENLDELSVRE